MTHLIPRDFSRCTGSPETGLVTCKRRHQCARHEQLKHDAQACEERSPSSFLGEVKDEGSFITLVCREFKELPGSESFG